MYYLRSRYYCSIRDRFISVDSLHENHLYRYCENNAVNRIDSEGTISISTVRAYSQLHDIVAFKVAVFVNGTTQRPFTRIDGAGPHGGFGYADVVDHDKHAWEVKSNAASYGYYSGRRQMRRYTNGTGFYPGYPVFITPFDYTFLNKRGVVYVTNGSALTDDVGVVYYEFVPYLPEHSPAEATAPERQKSPQTGFVSDSSVATRIGTVALLCAGLGAVFSSIGGGYAGHQRQLLH